MLELVRDFEQKLDFAPRKGQLVLARVVNKPAPKKPPRRLGILRNLYLTHPLGPTIEEVAKPALYTPL